MPGNPRGLRCGAFSFPAPPDIMGSAEDSREGGGILRVIFTGLQGGNAGGTAVHHHLQCGGGCGGDTLGQGGGGGC